MQTSEAGRTLIKQFEGVRLTSYRDVVGILTIGVGHTANVFENETITPQEADEFLAIDLHNAERAILNNVKVPLNQNQFDALSSFIFNIGGGAFSKSTLLKLLNQGDYLGAASQFLAWDMAGGQEQKGLKNRRYAERDLFMTPEAV
jgi:lysozyme